MDPSFKTGKLKNGIKYILKGDLKEKKAYFYACYNTGAIREESHEYGFAHLLEHLLIQKSYTHFQNWGKLKNSDINGNTTWNQTRVEIFEVPVQDDELLDSAVLHLKDMAFWIKKCNSNDFEKEKSIVQEEWRLDHQDNDNGFDEKKRIVSLKGSRYSRPGILVDTAVIKHCTLAEVERFYRKWYTTDNLTIVVIGNFSTKEMQKRIKRAFKGIPMTQSPSSRTFYPVPELSQKKLTFKA